MKKLAVCLLFLACCDHKVGSDKAASEDLKEIIMRSMRYFKDPYTDLCYGYAWTSRNESNGEGGPIVVNVPCEAVLKLLEAPLREAPLKRGYNGEEQ